MHRALDLGSTLLDTADMYGPFTNELLLGRALKERREDAFVSTKVGLLVGEQHIVANGRPGYVNGPATRRCGASRRMSSTSTSCTGRTPRCPSRRPGARWRSSSGPGKVRALGLCAVGARGWPPVRGPGCTTRRSGSCERVQQVFPVSAVQAELSVWSPEALEALLPWCAARGIGFLAAMPLGNGFLTGTLTPGEGFEPDDVRARHPRFTAEMMAANQPIVAGLRRVARRHGDGRHARPRWPWRGCWRRGRHVVPVPGAKQERWVTQNARRGGRCA